jgi:single-strand DNA-binding protein
MSVNKVILVGRLGTNPELRQTSSTQVTKFNLATNETWNDKDGKKQERTDWHKIVVWGKRGENCAKYLSKGSRAYVEGKLSTRSYEDKAGVTKWITEIVADNVQFIDGIKNDSKPEEAAFDASYDGNIESINDDEIPF